MNEARRLGPDNSASIGESKTGELQNQKEKKRIPNKT